MNVIRSRLRILVLLISRIVMMVVICSVLRYAEIRGERSNIVINEVCSNNYSSLKGENGDYPDYIELYNAGNKSISLKNYSLSDSKNGMEKSRIGDIVIEAQSYAVIYADDKKEKGHVNFKVNKNGEMVFLISPEGNVIDSVEIPELRYNTSFSRTNDGGNLWERMEATPGKSNNDAGKAIDPDIDHVLFSAESGFYEKEFELTLKGPEEYEIYYTLDGSEVSTNAKKYVEPIKIEDISENSNRLASREDLSPKDIYEPCKHKVDKAMVVRAALYDKKVDCLGRAYQKHILLVMIQEQNMKGFRLFR